MADLRYTAREILELNTRKTKELQTINDLLSGLAQIKKLREKSPLIEEFKGVLEFNINLYKERYLNKGDK
jgi:hypothetical protein